MVAHLIYSVCFFILVRCINAYQLLVVSLNAGYTRCHSDRIFSVQTKSQTHSACSFPVRHTPGDSFTAAHDSLTVLKCSWLAWLLWRMSVSVKKKTSRRHRARQTCFVTDERRLKFTVEKVLYHTVFRRMSRKRLWLRVYDQKLPCKVVLPVANREGGWDNRPRNSKESYPLCSTDGASFLKIQLTTGDLYYYYYFFASVPSHKNNIFY